MNAKTPAQTPTELDDQTPHTNPTETLLDDCPVHTGSIHGGEAEELRGGIEEIVETLKGFENSTDVRLSLINLLDSVDARDSLAHLERNDVIAKLTSERDAALLILRQAMLERDRTLLQVAQLSRHSHETSATIARWQTETFGPATTTMTRILRSSQMIRDAMRRTWRIDLSQPRPNLSRAVRAVEELAELIDLLISRDDDPKAVEETADIQIVLAAIPAAHGQEAQDAVDAKMAVNRSRTWKVEGDGHGQHILDKPRGVTVNEQTKRDPVNPSHYKGDTVMRIIEEFSLGFCLGNVVKYVLRHKNKAGVEDLKKARWYLDREIARQEGILK